MRIAERHDVDSIAGQRDRLEIVYVVADIEHNSWLELTSCSPDVYFVICAFQIVLVLEETIHIIETLDCDNYQDCIS